MERNFTNRRWKLFILAILIFPMMAMAQQGITFTRVIGGNGIESGHDFVALENGDYVIAGLNTTYSMAGDSDVYLVRVKGSDGTEIWHKSIGGFKADMAYSIQKTSDNNLIMVGYRTESQLEDIYVVKFNDSGTVLWQQLYGGAGIDVGREIKQTADGGYIITGYTNGAGGPAFDAVLLKIDANGTQQWMKTYGYSVYEEGFSVVQTSDGGYMMLGQTFGKGNFDFYLVSTNANGDTLWTKTFGGAGLEEGQCIIAASDGGFIMTGDQEKPNHALDFDVNITKLDDNGKIIWTKTFGGSDKDVTKMIQKTSDGGYVVAAISRSPEIVKGQPNPIQPDFWILRLNSGGDTTWTKHYGGLDHEHCYAAKQTADGGFFSVGHSDSFSNCAGCAPTLNLFMVKTDASGKVVGIGNIENKKAEFTLIPNPTSGKCIMKTENKDVQELRIINLAGESVFQKEFKKIGEEELLDLTGLAKGIYMVSLISQNGVETKKLVVY